MTTIGEVFRIPDHVHQGDFVLKLTEGVSAEHADETLRDYVVTDQLVRAFDQSLGLIQSALNTRTSKGAYLHGSFGSGKSHFMAVLTLLLDGHTGARSVPELAPVVSRHNAWLGRRILVVPLHLIGAPSLEAAVLGGYARHIRERHPNAPTPGFYRGDALFENARELRQRIGDGAFFAALGERAGASGGWGALDKGWTAESFDAAVQLASGDPERARLVGDLVDTFFSSTAALAGNTDEGFVAMEDGLLELSRHAQALGYEGVVLFLDEVMLWLASHATDRHFLTQEAHKLVKFVEAGRMARPIPLVSFLARQRNLRELVSEHLAGAEQLAVTDVLQHWEGRFDTVTLEDRNLPAIIERRLLRPRDDRSRALIAEAHVQTERIRDDVLNVLLAGDGDRAMFKQVYPFSPVLVRALIAISSLLQRERTALKLLMQLLVRRRDLVLGDVMPVGELWDVIEHGGEPFSAVLRERFVQAKRLWTQKLVPLLDEDRARAIADGTPIDAADRRQQEDARLLKTLLLAALAEGVEALDQVTAQRLTALNHGTVRSPIPGQEARVVLDKLRRWAGRVGEVRLSTANNPTVTLHLVGVDTDAILENVQAADNFGARVRMVRVLLSTEAEIELSTSLLPPLRDVQWKGTTRKLEVYFANVRTLAPEQFRPMGAGADWRLVIDYPFDDPQYSPSDDQAAVNLASAAGEHAQSIVWLPAFLTLDAQRDLGKLVLLDHVLTGKTLDAAAAHLSAQDRSQARVLLENQRESLGQTIRNALFTAYGLSTTYQSMVDASHGLSSHFQTLMPGLTLRAPVTTTFSDAVDQLMAQSLAWQFPLHPDFAVDLRPASLRTVWDWIKRASQDPGGRVEVERGARDEMMRIAVPLGLGEMREAHFVLTRQWETSFTQAQARDGIATITVGRVRTWLDQPRARGLTAQAQNLVILTWALLSNRSLHLHGSATPYQDPSLDRLDKLPDDLEIRTQSLPDEQTWRTALQRAAELFGVDAPSHRSAQSVAMLAQRVTEKADALREGAQRYAATLDQALARLHIAAGDDRQRSAAAARDVVTALAAQKPDGVLRVLSTTAIPTTATAVGEALAKGSELSRHLTRVQWELVASLRSLPTSTFGARADAEINALTTALAHDEHAAPLSDAVDRFNREGFRLLAEAARMANPDPPIVAPPIVPPPAPVPPRAGTIAKTKHVRAREVRPVLDELRQDIDKSGDAMVHIEWRIEPE